MRKREARKFKLLKNINQNTSFQKVSENGIIRKQLVFTAALL